MISERQQVYLHRYRAEPPLAVSRRRLNVYGHWSQRRDRKMTPPRWNRDGGIYQAPRDQGTARVMRKPGRRPGIGTMRARG